MNKIQKTILLAQLIFSECGICPVEEQALVGQVVLDRIESEQFPNTLEDVIYQERQFHGIWTDNCEYNKTTFKISEKLIDNNTINSKDILYFVTKSTYKESFAKNMMVQDSGRYHYFF